MLRLRELKLVYRFAGKTYSLSAAYPVSDQRVALSVVREGGLFSMSLSCNVPVVLVSLSAEFDYGFRNGCRVFMNGYQSWTESREKPIGGRMHGIGHIPRRTAESFSLPAYGDYSFAAYSGKRGVMHGFSYGYVRNGAVYDLFGSLDEDSGFTLIRTDSVHSRISFSKDCRGLRVRDNYEGLRIIMLSGREEEVFDGYFHELGIAPPTAKPIFGYTSWYRHYYDISEGKLLRDLKGLISLPFKADVFQIDDGYETAVGDWLSFDRKKFPHGMAEMAKSIAEKGLIPGLWLAPFCCGRESRIFKEHPDWVVKDEKGEPLRAAFSWGGGYALDIYNEGVRGYLREVFDTVINKWGYRLLKLDFLYVCCVKPRPDKTRGQMMAEGMELLREYTKGAQILGCGVPLASAFGRVDYCRIGCDVTPEWKGKAYGFLMHRERPSAKNSLLCSVFRRQLNGRAFINDPDVFYLRDDRVKLTSEQKRALAEINALTGGVLFTSDDAGLYTEKQLRQLRSILSLRGTRVVSAELSGRVLRLVLERDGEVTEREYSL
ncbi:MAG: alpha-galactosidase [Ruminococcus sp.]|nr:alpha-galactosidase [Ruminococcus sp.]